MRHPVQCVAHRKNTLSGPLFDMPEEARGVVTHGPSVVRKDLLEELEGRGQSSKKLAPQALSWWTKNSTGFLPR